MSSRLIPKRTIHFSYLQYIPLIFLSVVFTKPIPSHLYQLLNTNECSSCNLASAELSYSNLTGSQLSSSNLKNAQLIYTDLSSADLTKANLENAILVGANLSSADLTGANLQGAIFPMPIFQKLLSAYRKLGQPSLSMPSVWTTAYLRRRISLSLLITTHQ